MKETLKHELKSGATLRGSLAEFKKGRALYQAVAKAAKEIEVKASDDLNVNLIKSFFLEFLSNKEVEACIWDCMGKMLYNDSKITEETFEPIEARQDYIEVMKEVAMFNAAPFTKNLFAELGNLTKAVEGFVQK